jgi:hypothetical protein
LSLSDRELLILRIVSDAKRIHTRGIIDKIHSPNRLSGCLIELVQRRLLHMEREGKKCYYTMTKLGTRVLAAYEVDASRASMDRLKGMDPEELKGQESKIQALEETVEQLQFKIKVLETLAEPYRLKTVGKEA